MKFIRHILSHLLLIILLAGLGTVYFYRHHALPEKYVTQIEHYAQAIHPKLLNIASSQPVKEPVAQAESQVELQKPVVKIENNDVPVAEEIKIETVVIEEKEVIVAEDDKKAEVVVSEKPGPEKTGEVNVVADAAVQVESVQETSNEQKKPEVEEVTVATDKDSAGFYNILRDARAAYEEGNMELAVKKYSELIELEHDVADFHGELGNVHYAMGNWEEAGVSYYEAAVRLMEKGQLSQVNYLQRVIQGLDAERAEKLSNKMVEIYRVNGIAR
jgi:hypothetical protein